VQILPQNGQTDITVRVRDARPNSSLPATLHTGTCEAPGPQVEELGTISTDQMGQGQAQLNVGIAANQIMNGMHILAIHAEGQDAAAPVACAELPQRDAAGMRQPGTTGQTQADETTTY
jgi:hypothetical protein